MEDLARIWGDEHAIVWAGPSNARKAAGGAWTPQPVGSPVIRVHYPLPGL